MPSRRRYSVSTGVGPEVEGTYRRTPYGPGCLSLRLDQDGYIIRAYARNEINSALDGKRDSTPVAMT
jgi:hypothetical protein